MCEKVCVFKFEERQIGRESQCALFHSCILRSEVCNLVWECINTHAHKYALLHTRSTFSTDTQLFRNILEACFSARHWPQYNTVGTVLRCCQVVKGNLKRFWWSRRLSVHSFPFKKKSTKNIWKAIWLYQEEDHRSVCQLLCLSFSEIICVSKIKPTAIHCLLCKEQTAVYQFM